MSALKELLYEFKLRQIFDKDITKLCLKFKCIHNVSVSDKAIAIQWIDMSSKQIIIVTNENLNDLSGEMKQAMEQFERIFVERIGL